MVNIMRGKTTTDTLATALNPPQPHSPRVILDKVVQYCIWLLRQDWDLRGLSGAQILIIHHILPWGWNLRTLVTWSQRRHTPPQGIKSIFFLPQSRNPKRLGSVGGLCTTHWNTKEKFLINLLKTDHSKYYFLKQSTFP